MLSNAIQLMRVSLRDRAGVFSTEHGILAVGVIAALTAAMTVFNTVLSDAFTSLGTLIKGAFGSATNGRWMVGRAGTDLRYAVSNGTASRRRAPVQCLCHRRRR